MSKAHLDAKQLALFVWNDLPAPEAHGIATHLAGCASCRELAHQFESVLQLEMETREAHQDGLPELKAAVFGKLSATRQRSLRP